MNKSRIFIIQLFKSIISSTIVIRFLTENLWNLWNLLHHNIQIMPTRSKEELKLRLKEK